MPPLQRTIYTGTFIYTPILGSLSISEHRAIGVDEEGVIRHITDLSPGERQHERNDMANEAKRVKAVAVKWGWGETGWKWVVGGQDGRSWWFPGFVGKLHVCKEGSHSFMCSVCTCLDATIPTFRSRKTCFLENLLTLPLEPVLIQKRLELLCMLYSYSRSNFVCCVTYRLRPLLPAKTLKMRHLNSNSLIRMYSYIYIEDNTLDLSSLFGQTCPSLQVNQSLKQLHEA